jgi:methionine synthase I (cobalamin-dependent)
MFMYVWELLHEAYASAVQFVCRALRLAKEAASRAQRLVERYMLAAMGKTYAPCSFRLLRLRL